MLLEQDIKGIKVLNLSWKWPGLASNQFEDTGQDIGHVRLKISLDILIKISLSLE